MKWRDALWVSVLAVTVSCSGEGDGNAGRGSANAAGSDGGGSMGGSTMGGSTMANSTLDEAGSGGGTMPATDSGCPTADPTRPYSVDVDELVCSQGAIVIGPRSCLWECIELQGEQARLEVLLEENASGCWVPNESIREPIVSGDGVCRANAE